MELRSGDVAPRDQRGDGTAIIGDRHDAIIAFGLERIGMHEIGVQALFRCRDSGKQRMRGKRV